MKWVASGIIPELTPDPAEDTILETDPELLPDPAEETTSEPVTAVVLSEIIAELLSVPVDVVAPDPVPETTDVEV